MNPEAADDLLAAAREHAEEIVLRRAVVGTFGRAARREHEEEQVGGVIDQSPRLRLKRVPRGRHSDGDGGSSERRWRAHGGIAGPQLCIRAGDDESALSCTNSERMQSCAAPEEKKNSRASARAGDAITRAR